MGQPQKFPVLMSLGLDNLYFEILFMLRPRLIETIKFCGCRDRDSSRLGISVVVETETHRDWEILWLSGPRLIETGKFCGVETETHRDWEILWLSRPRLIETGKFCGCRDQDSSRLVILWLSRPRLIETGNFCGCRDNHKITSLDESWSRQPQNFPVSMSLSLDNHRKSCPHPSFKAGRLLLP